MEDGKLKMDKDHRNQPSSIIHAQSSLENYRASALENRANPVFIRVIRAIRG